MPDEGIKRTSFDLPEVLWRRAKVRAVEEGRDLRLLVIDALEQYLGRKQKKGVSR